MGVKVSRKRERERARSGQMECEVCHNKRLLVCHHIHGRDIPQWNNDWNRSWVCPDCHDSIHSGKVIIEERAMTTSGRKLIWRKKGEENIAFENANTPLYGEKR